VLDSRAARTRRVIREPVAAPPPPRRLDLWLLLAALVFLFFWRAAILDGVFFYGDAGNVYQPRLAWTGQELRAGRFPLWNPYLSLGAPHPANPRTMGFYPPHLILFSLLPPNAAYNYDVLLHLLLAALGMRALARSWGQSDGAATLAGLVYALGGFTLVHLQHLNILVALAWIPAVFVFTERFLDREDLRSLGLAALCLGLQLLGGHPQLAVYGVLALGGYVLTQLPAIAASPPSTRTRALAGLAALVPLGLALAAVFLLPFAEWTRFVSLTERFATAEAGRFVGDDPGRFSLPPERLVGFVAPFWQGGSLARPRLGDRLVEFTGYVGVLPLGLAAVGLFASGRRKVFLAVLGVTALLLALGSFGPLYPVVARWPVLGWGRTPARYLMLVELALALLAGFGLDRLPVGTGRRVAWAVSAVFILAATVVTAVCRNPPATEALLGRPDVPSVMQADTLALLATLAGAAAVLALLSWPAVPQRVRVGLALAFAAADLFYFRSNLPFLGVAPADVYTASVPTVEAVRRNDEPRRFFLWTAGLEKPSWLLYEQPDLPAYRSRVRESLPNALPLSFALQSFSGSGIEPPFYRELVYLVGKRREFDSRSASLVGLFAGGYVFGGRQLTAPELRVVEPGTVSVFRNDAALPRAYLVPASREVDSARAAFGAVKNPDFDPRQAVVVEEPGPAFPEGLLASARAEIVEDEADRVVVTTSAERPAWLVLNDTYGPGWTASIDGRPASLFRANALVRAVPVPAGRHEVGFAYRPASVRVGAAVSIAALGVVAALVLAGRRLAAE
jgi:hypothetical protein